MEIINLKIKLAKEKSTNKSLRDEITDLHKNHASEVQKLQETVEIQSAVISELSQKCETLELMNKSVEESRDQAELEADLVDSSWSIVDKVSEENVKLIVKLACEVDQLKEKAESTYEQLETTKAQAEKLQLQLNSEKNQAFREKQEMISIQSDLARDILDLKVHHEHELGLANVQIRKHMNKNKSLKTKLVRVRAGADNFIATNNLLRDYDVIC